MHDGHLGRGNYMSLQASKLPLLNKNGKTGILMGNNKKYGEAYTAESLMNIKDYFSRSAHKISASANGSNPIDQAKFNHMKYLKENFSSVQEQEEENAMSYSASAHYFESLDMQPKLSNLKNVIPERPSDRDNQVASPVKQLMKKLNPNANFLNKKKPGVFGYIPNPVEEQTVTASQQLDIGLSIVGSATKPAEKQPYRIMRKPNVESQKMIDNIRDSNSPKKRRPEFEIGNPALPELESNAETNRKSSLAPPLKLQDKDMEDPIPSSNLDSYREEPKRIPPQNVTIKKVIPIARYKIDPRSERTDLKEKEKEPRADGKPEKLQTEVPRAERAIVERPPKKVPDFMNKNSEKDKEKEKEMTLIAKINAYKDFMLKINFTYCLSVKPPSEKNFLPYKFYLCKGNNSMLIRSLMKQRWWWTQVDSKDGEFNFIWTQFKQTKFIKAQKCKKKPLPEANEVSTISSTVNVNDVTTSADSFTDSESETDADLNKKIGKKTRSAKRSETSKDKNPIGQKEEKKEKEGVQKLLSSRETMLLSSYNVKKLEADDYENLAKAKKSSYFQQLTECQTSKVSNHLEDNFHLGNKKALLYNMRLYYNSIGEDVFNYLPLTFHIKTGLEDKEFAEFCEYFKEREREIQEYEQSEEAKKKKGNKPQNIWIVKPGEDTNRGNGIHVCNEMGQIRELVGSIQNGTRTYLIQKYLDKPLLWNKRKFDIRTYLLLTSINGVLKGYWYQEGYIRTSSKEFTLKNVTNRLIHLTNDAVQKKAEDYGKFETGNKVSWGDFSKYIETMSEGKKTFERDIHPQLKNLATDAIKSAYTKLDPNRRENNFEILGLDFMIDASYKAWLIEVNSNPDINTCCPQLTRVIPPMLENALRIALDPLFPPPNYPLTKKNLYVPDIEANKFELVFDELEDGPALKNLGQGDNLAMDLIFENEEEDEDN